MNTDDGLTSLIAQATHPALMTVPAWPMSVPRARIIDTPRSPRIPFRATSTPAVPAAALAGFAETSPSLFADAARMIGGEGLRAAAAKVNAAHGEQTAADFVAAVGADDELREAYIAREEAVDDAVLEPTALNTRAAKVADVAVRKAGNVVLDAVLKGKGQAKADISNTIKTFVGALPKRKKGQHGVKLPSGQAISNAAQKAAISGAVAVGTKAAGTTAALLIAGGGASTIPVAGWVAAAGLASAAGVLALVNGVKKGKVKRARAVRLAKRLGVERADQAPVFIVRALKMDPKQRDKVGKRLARRLKRVKPGRRRRQLKLKLQLLAAAELAMKQRRRRRRKKRRARKAAKRGMNAFAMYQQNALRAPMSQGYRTDTGTALEVAGVPGPFARAGFGALGAVASDELEVRMSRAWDGDLTEGGVADPREAAAFVSGYLTQRYLPSRRKKGQITTSADVKLQMLASQFRAATSGTPESARSIALSIGDSSTIDQLKNRLTSAFAAARAGTPTRTAAIEVLQHAAALVSAAKHPQAAERFRLAVDTSTAASGSVLEAVADGAQDVVKSVSNDIRQKAADVDEQTKAILDKISFKSPAEAAKAAKDVVDKVAEDTGLTGAVDAAKNQVAGGLNVATEAAKAAKEATEERLDAALEQAQNLAATGVKGVERKLAEVRELAESVPRQVGVARDELLDKLSAAKDDLTGEIAKVKQAGSDLQKRIAADVEGKFNAALAAADTARKTAAKLPGLVQDAVESKVGELSDRLTGVRADLERRLDKTVKDLMADPCRVVPAGAARDRCQATREDPCSLLPPGPSQWACRNPRTATMGPLVALLGALVLGLALFLRGR